MDRKAKDRFKHKPVDSLRPRGQEIQDQNPKIHKILNEVDINDFEAKLKGFLKSGGKINVKSLTMLEPARFSKALKILDVKPEDIADMTDIIFDGVPDLRMATEILRISNSYVREFILRSSADMNPKVTVKLVQKFNIDIGSVFSHRTVREGLLLHRELTRDEIRFVLERIEDIDLDDGNWRVQDFPLSVLESVYPPDFMKKSGGWRMIIEKIKSSNGFLGLLYYVGSTFMVNRKKQPTQKTLPLEMKEDIVRYMFKHYKLNVICYLEAHDTGDEIDTLLLNEYIEQTPRLKGKVVLNPIVEYFLKRMRRIGRHDIEMKTLMKMKGKVNRFLLEGIVNLPAQFLENTICVSMTHDSRLPSYIHEDRLSLRQWTTTFETLSDEEIDFFSRKSLKFAAYANSFGKLSYNKRPRTISEQDDYGDLYKVKINYPLFASDYAEKVKYAFYNKDYSLDLEEPTDECQADEGEICTICTSSITRSKLILNPNSSQSTRTCQHAFHPSCILRWFGQEKRTCPSCREVTVLAGISLSDDDDVEVFVVFE